MPLMIAATKALQSKVRAFQNYPLYGGGGRRPEERPRLESFSRNGCRPSVTGEEYAKRFPSISISMQVRLAGLEGGRDRGLDVVGLGDVGAGDAHALGEVDEAQHRAGQVHVHVGLVATSRRSACGRRRYCASARGTRGWPGSRTRSAGRDAPRSIAPGSNTSTSRRPTGRGPAAWSGRPPRRARRPGPGRCRRRGR